MYKDYVLLEVEHTSSVESSVGLARASQRLSRRDHGGGVEGGLVHAGLNVEGLLEDILFIVCRGLEEALGEWSLCNFTHERGNVGTFELDQGEGLLLPERVDLPEEHALLRGLIASDRGGARC
mgnify:CR=1 FL=1